MVLGGICRDIVFSVQGFWHSAGFEGKRSFSKRKHVDQHCSTCSYFYLAGQIFLGTVAKVYVGNKNKEV